MRGGNGVAWLAFVTGAVVSVGANVLHALDGGGPVEAGRVIASGWAPVALLLVAELVARARTAGPWWIIALRWVGTGVVATVAAVVSYGHMRDLLLSYGETVLVAHLLPLSVDGLLLVASLALAAPKGPHGPPLDAPTVEGERFVTLAAPNTERAWSGKPITGATARAAADGPREVVTAPIDDEEGTRSVRTPGGGTPADERAAARQAFRAALAAGQRITGKELAARFGKSERWGRDRIRECQTA